ncbi:molybdenum cofactor guanylyltransferase MobA [Hoeflea sp.]|uniref:molybdenum cofactor guanylyltransferase MobA n=1 Tax=Hoeflea sp. TaxID=1940281 RepID=UPI003B52D2B5
MKPVCGILAGGKGRRMEGIDKPLAQLGGRPLIAHVIARVSLQSDAILINANGSADRFERFGLPVVADRIEGYKGPLAGIHALMLASQDLRIDHLLAVPADTPFLPSDLFDRLSGASRDRGTVRIARSSGRRHPVVALWPVSLAADLGEYLAGTSDLSLASYLRKIRHVDVDFTAEDGPDPFFNINSPDELDQAEALLGAHKTGF